MTAKQRLSDRKAKLTVKEVAQRANVSESTVSRILREKGPVAEATREKVLEVVKTLGYVPNRIAGSLASLNSNLIGVIVPSLSNIVFPEVLKGVHAGLEVNSRMQAVISISDYDIEKEESLIRGLLSWKPAAVLTAGFEHTDATCKMLETSNTRVVEMMDIDSDPIDVAVGMSHHSAGRATVKHLIAKGYRKFGYVGSNWDKDYRARYRFQGMEEELSKAGLAFEAKILGRCPSSVRAGREMTGRILSDSPQVDIIIFSNDDMAVGGVFHCLAAGISIPDEIAVFGFNGLEIGKEMPMPLSTVVSNRFEIGRRAVETVLATTDRPEAPTIIDTGFEIFDGATA